MKKTIGVVIFLSFVQLAVAQIGKSQNIIGIDFSINNSSRNTEYNSSASDKSENTRMDINPYWDHFLTDNFSIGFSPGYSLSKQQNTSNDALVEYEFASYSANLRLRKFYSLKEKWYFVLNGNIGYARREATNTYNYNDVSIDDTKSVWIGNSIGGSIRPSVIYFINDRFGIETSFGFLRYDYGEDKLRDDPPSVADQSSRKHNTFNASFSLSSLNFGLQYLF